MKTHIQFLMWVYVYCYITMAYGEKTQRTQRPGYFSNLTGTRGGALPPITSYYFLPILYLSGSIGSKYGLGYKNKGFWRTQWDLKYWVLSGSNAYYWVTPRQNLMPICRHKTTSTAATCERVAFSFGLAICSWFQHFKRSLTLHPTKTPMKSSRDTTVIFNRKSKVVRVATTEACSRQCLDKFAVLKLR